jgi:hypothetical protein
VMILVWVLYVVILLSERRIFRSIFIQKESARIETVFRRLTVFHWFILSKSSCRFCGSVSCSRRDSVENLSFVCGGRIASGK